MESSRRMDKLSKNCFFFITLYLICEISCVISTGENDREKPSSSASAKVLPIVIMQQSEVFKIPKNATKRRKITTFDKDIKSSHERYFCAPDEKNQKKIRKASTYDSDRPNISKNCLFEKSKFMGTNHLPIEISCKNDEPKSFISKLFKRNYDGISDANFSSYVYDHLSCGPTSDQKMYRRADKTPNESSRVCSCHFLDGKKSSTPTIFQWTQNEQNPPSTPDIPIQLNVLIVPDDNSMELDADAIPERDNDTPFLQPQPEPVESDNQLQFIQQSPTQFIQQSPTHCDQITQTDINVNGAFENQSTQTIDMQSQVEMELWKHQSTQTINSVQHQSTQTINSVQSEAEITLLQIEVERLKSENEILKKKEIRCSDIDKNQKQFEHYTGISKSAFNALIILCEKVDFEYLKYTDSKNKDSKNKDSKNNRQRRRKLSFRDEVLLTLMKLRLNFTNKDLGFRFGVSPYTVSTTFRTILLLLHELFQNLMNEIPSQQKNKESMPASFDKFPNCRIIIDCFEVPTEIPEEFTDQCATYSNYKHYHTSKVLLGIAPNGTATFVSEAFPGSTSDKAVVIGSKLMEKMHKGDLILADKGFLLRDILPDSVSLNIPPFLSASRQFSAAEVEETYNIAAARIHVERAIRRIKAFRILDLIRKKNFRYATEIIQTIVGLTNLKGPLIKSVGEHLGTFDYVMSEDDGDD